MGQIVDKFVKEIEDLLGDRHVEIRLSDEARALLAERGYDPAFGARPLGRVMDERLKRPMTEELLFGALKDGGVVEVGVEAGEIRLTYAPPSSPAEIGASGV